MVFSSIVFLFLFLPFVLTFYFLIPRQLKNLFLLFASLFFYAWGEGLFVLVMLLSIAANYLSGILIARFRGLARVKWILAGAIGINLGLLGIYKYANFLVDNLNQLLSVINISPIVIDAVHLPIGISFFTFQAISYLIDVYREEAPVQKNPINIALYIASFPQLIAGPIVRYHDVAQQIVSRVVSLEDFACGVERFIWGLGKKVLIANTLGGVADQIFALPGQELTAELAWLGLVCYSLQIYFDFSAYSDMAIGLGRMFGFSIEKCAEIRSLPSGDIAWLKETEPYATHCKQSDLRALMIGDSYSVALALYFSEHFQNIAYVYTRAWEAKTVKILTHFVEQEKPQLVIDERLERVLQYLPDKYEETSLEHKHMKTEATFNLKEGVLSLHIVKFSATEFYHFTMKFDEIAQQFKMTAMVPVASKDKVLANFSVATGVLDIPLVKVTVAPKQTLFYEAKLKRLESGSEWRFIIENLKEKK